MHPTPSPPCPPCPPFPALTCSRQHPSPQKQGRQDPRVYCRKTRSTANGTQTPHGAGLPHAGGQGWVTASEAWQGPQHQRCLGRLASSQGGLQPPLPPSPVLPRVGKADQVRPGLAQRLCYQGVSLRKGCDPLSSQEPLPGLGSRWQLWGPWTGWRLGLSYAQTQASDWVSLCPAHRGTTLSSGLLGHLAAAIFLPLSLSLHVHGSGSL